MRVYEGGGEGGGGEEGNIYGCTISEGKYTLIILPLVP